MYSTRIILVELYGHNTCLVHIAAMLLKVVGFCFLYSVQIVDTVLYKCTNNCYVHRYRGWRSSEVTATQHSADKAAARWRGDPHCTHQCP